MGDSFILPCMHQRRVVRRLINLVDSLNQFHISGEKESWREKFTFMQPIRLVYGNAKYETF